jgi:hypothetical protein
MHLKKFYHDAAPRKMEICTCLHVGPVARKCAQKGLATMRHVVSDDDAPIFPCAHVDKARLSAIVRRLTATALPPAS